MDPSGTTVSFGLSVDGWRAFPDLVNAFASSTETRSICEVGGGAKPALDRATIDRYGLRYTLLDISAEELAKAPPHYEKVQADIAGALPRDIGRYDLVFSKTLAEHVHDAEMFHRNVYQMLTDGGTAVHFFPTLFAPAFVVNLLLPTAVTRWLLTRLQGPRRDDQGLEGKFPAFYRWCRGPSDRQVQRLRALGYEVVEYRGYFGTPGYYERLRLTWLDDFLSRVLLRFKVSQFTSYAVVVLRRPATGGGASSPRL